MKFNPLHLLYLPRSAARACGMTHEGTLYGIPAWIAVSDNANEFLAAPKVPALQLLALLADAVAEALTYLLPSDCQIETPLHINQPIGDA